jgi:CO/xanthine dehydrogenase Mo-binding subunit
MTMATKFFGKRIKRNEDPRLLTGQALFVDDVNLPGMLHAAYYRSPYAHARIKNVDASKAREREGVVAVYTAEDLGDYWRTGMLNVQPPPIEGAVFNERLHAVLAKGKVRHVGESIACVVAESRYIAEDAVHDIVVDFEPLPVNVDPQKALENGAVLIHEDLENNLAAHVIQQNGDYEKAKAEADVVIKRRFDRLGHHPGAGDHPQRARRDTGAIRTPGPGDRTVHRRRFWGKGPDVQCRGIADPLAFHAVRMPGKMD